VSLATLSIGNPGYPERLEALPKPPSALTVEGGGLDHAPRRVAIVGTREPSAPASQFAFDLASALARAGVVVVSGGALGIDAAAHRGALSAGGRTWVVAPTGRGRCFPEEHAELFLQVASGTGAMIWPFPVGMEALRANFHRRNGILVALADVVTVVQAGAPSGTLNALAWARRLGRPIWAVPGPPWDPQFVGCRGAIDGGARVLTSIAGFLRALDLDTEQLGLPLDSPPPRSVREVRISDPAGKAVWSVCTTTPRHIDEIAADARVCMSTAATQLLTLALENVLVEGPEGFYRRAE
jgi:DNA processing protein